MKIEERELLLEAMSKLGPPPMTAKTETLHVLGSRDWGDYRLDWGISGPRGGPDEIAGLRGIRRPGGDYIPADEIRAVNEFVCQHSARGPVALTDAITALEAASWRKLPISPVGKAKRLIAKLSPEEREMLREALSERHEGKPGK